MRLKYTYFLLLFYTISFSQNINGKVHILLKDEETGISLINDTITVTTNDSITNILITDNEGITYLNGIVPGKHSIKIYRKGYKSKEIRGIAIRENSTTSIVFGLNKEDGPINYNKKKKRGVKLKLVK